MVTHRAIINRLKWMWQSYPFEPNEVCSQRTSLSFVDSVAEIFSPLLCGIRNVVLPDDIVKDPEALVSRLEREHVTRLLLVPSLLRLLLNQYSDLGHRVPSLKLVVASGEEFSEELCRQCQQALPGVVLLNLYGSSEVAADVTYYQLSKNELSAPLIGRPIANSQVYLLDENMLLVPTGSTGEIYVGGHGLAPGYLHRPVLTADSFVPNPFSAEPGHRLYRTGDLGRWREDGNLEYLGRRDQQVKLRGLRIELGEIETALREHPGIASAAVSIHQKGEEDARLVAYIVKRNSEDEITPGEVRAHLQDRLPEYMLPTVVLFLPALPLLPNGKLDRNSLPAADGVSLSSPAQYVAPRDEIEEILANMWQEVLHLDQIGVQDNFFAVGGHSLVIARVMMRVRALFRVEVPLRSFFALESPTIAGLAQLLISREPQPGYVLQVAKAMARINNLSESELEELAKGKASA
jgi:acyl-coenzyme A synthetase/AMP-(fatty) acid ligase